MVSRGGKSPLLLVLAIFCASAMVGSCTLWSDYSDGLTCGKDEDCFRAQGEVCDLAIKQCVAGPSPRVPAPGAESGSATQVEAFIEASAATTSDATLSASQVQP